MAPATGVHGPVTAGADSRLPALQFTVTWLPLRAMLNVGGCPGTGVVKPAGRGTVLRNPDLLR